MTRNGNEWTRHQGNEWNRLGNEWLHGNEWSPC